MRLGERLPNCFLQKTTSKSVIPAGPQRGTSDGVIPSEISLLVAPMGSEEARSIGVIPKKIGDLVGPMGFAETSFNGVSSLRFPNWSFQWGLQSPLSME